MKKCFLLACLFSISCFPFFASQVPHNADIVQLLAEIDHEPVDTVKIKKIIEVLDLYPETSSKRLECAQKALDLSWACNWERGKGISHYYLAWYYFFNNNQKLTIDNFEEAVKYLDDPMALVYSYGFLSNIYSWRKDHNKAFEYAYKALDIAEEYDLTELKANAHLFLGDAFRYSGQRQESSKHYFISLALIENDNAIAVRENTQPSTTRFTHSLTNIAYLYTLNGYVDSPFYLLKFALSMKDAYDNSNALEKQIYMVSLIKVATAFNISAKNEIVKQIEIENKEKQNKIYIIGLSVLVLMTITLVYQNYQRKKTNTQLALVNDELAKVNDELDEANRMKTRFFGILNHDLRRPVSGLISYLELKKKSPQILDTQQQAVFEQKTIDMTQELLENMENLLFWCKSQMENFEPVIKDVSIMKLLQDTDSFFQYENRIQKTCCMEEDIIIKTDENYVKTILRNITLNAIKSLENVENAKIEWKAWINKDFAFISIKNNGPCIPEDKINILYEATEKNNIKDGLGLIIIRDLARAINCKIEVHNGETEKVAFILSFRI